MGVFRNAPQHINEIIRRKTYVNYYFVLFIDLAANFQFNLVLFYISSSYCSEKV